ncbi:hypothetical protein VTP01DRAFT_2694 [Rhizomucor pusillus]|uniref:mitochondrial 54S ribosomal mL61 domain-containing protein n=1 Tax=Rhizomucor pusillus TaxID=4840 RepID=UPI003743174E
MLKKGATTASILQFLRTGPGAAKLPPNVTKISLTYAFKGVNESQAAKKFLREGMPRLQYNNPNVEFAIIRSTDPQTAPVVTVHFGNQTKAIEIPPKYQNEDVCKLVFEAKP